MGHGELHGWVDFYGSLAFGIVCTFWVIHEVKQLFK